MEETQTTAPVSNLKNNLAIPIAIVLAGALIAGAIFISNKKSARTATAPEIQKADVTVPFVSANEHILGNPKAKIVVVEYSDLQCPFCTDFHKTMTDVMAEYGKNGDVAWVYRHYWAPRKMQDGSIFHPLGGKAAEASECVAELGGNDKFWAFVNTVFADKDSQTTKLSQLPETAEKIGVERVAFTACLDSGKYTASVQKTYDEAKALGVSGTPTSFLLTKEGTYPIEGYLPTSEIKTIIESVLE